MVAKKLHILALSALVFATTARAEKKDELLNHDQKEDVANYWESFKTGYMAGIYMPLLPLTFFKPVVNTVRHAHWDSDKSVLENVKAEKEILKRSYAASAAGVVAGWATLTLGTIVAFKLLGKVFHRHPANP